MAPESTELEDRYAQLLDAAPDAMIVVSAEGTIQLANVQTEKLFGYTRDELVGKPLELLIPDRFRGGPRRPPAALRREPDHPDHGLGARALSAGVATARTSPSR